MLLPAIRDFAAEAVDPNHYVALSAGWSIASADVIGSTKLAADGRHREVNFVAAAAVAVLSAVLEDGGGDASCVQFGGDGAIAAVPLQRRAAVEQALAALAHWSIHDLNVPIRVGLVDVAELIEAGLDARIARQELGAGNGFGLFLGSGIAAAEAWVKAHPHRQLEPRSGNLPGLSSLSCRWQPVPACRGVVLCIIADPVDGGPAGLTALARFQRELEAIVPTSAAAPLGDGERLKPRWPPSSRSLWIEARTVSDGRRGLRVVRALVGSLLVLLINALDQPLFGFDPRRYRRGIAAYCDYRKASGGIRYVLDVTEDEAVAIQTLLERHDAMGTIRYGLSRAEATTFACLVGDLAADRHVHFVDGDRLGFWRASVMLKERYRKEK